MPLPYLPTPNFTDYDWVVVHLFRRLTASFTLTTVPEVLAFDLDDVRDAVASARNAGVLRRKKIKNMADIKYAYDARRDFPPELMQPYPRTWLSVSKGKYILRRTKRKNIIDLQSLKVPPPPIEFVIDQAPSFTSSLMGTDEQAVLARVRYAGLLNQILGFQATTVQGHHRTSVAYGQVEVDEVLAGLHGTTGIIVPISGKGGQDKISWSQSLNLNTYGSSCLARYGTLKHPMTGVDVRSLCLWLDKTTNEVWVVEFTNDLEIDHIDVVDVRRYKFL